MSTYAVTCAAIEAAVRTAVGDKVKALSTSFDQVELQVSAPHWLEVAAVLRDTTGCQFEQLIDLCGVDYSEYGAGRYEGSRFAVVVQLMSVTLNQRLRVKIFLDNDDFPMVDSVSGVWSSAGWLEREAFDLFGIVFQGHTDLRRILTDYGFIGHPFRKDFPLSGHVEMRYDADQARVVYQPVSIEPREITPRIIREEHYGDLH